MASTNKTTHYELSQYIGTDKPTYLVDYNGDMSKIDTGIYDADAKASLNATAIGTLSSLTTTAKSDLVSAINEVDNDLSGIGDLTTLTTSTKSSCVGAINEVDADIGLLSNLTTTAKTNLVSAVNEVDGVSSTNQSNIGTMSNLNTTDKTSLVGAINEVDSDIKKFDFTTFTTYGVSDVSYTGNGNLINCSLTLAKNSDGSIVKLYGDFYVAGATNNGNLVISNTGLSPSEEISIKNLGLYIGYGAGGLGDIYGTSATFKTNGDIYITVASTGASGSMRKCYFPCVIFLKQFGDTPNAQ